jgi:Domain of unknown function (DUF4401)
MNRERDVALWARLRAAGIVSDGDTPGRDDLPWYLAALIGIAAWIAAVFLTGFVLTGLDDVFRQGALACSVGVACCAVALGLLRIARGRDFIEQFAIAIGLVGLVMIGVGVYASVRPYGLRSGPARAHWIAVMTAALAMYALGRPTMHRFLCGLVAALALAGLCIGDDEETVAALASPLLVWTAAVAWWWSAGGRRHASALSPLAWALTLVGIGLIWWVDSLRSFTPDAPAAHWRLAADLIAAPLLPLCVAWLSSGMRGSHRIWAIALAAVFALLLLRAPGVGICIAVALTGFALHRPALLAVGCAALVLYLFHYYYQLSVPLLHKSYWLLGGGVALLFARAAWLRLMREEAA